jgi:multidrug resistance efflux pump
MTWLRKMRPLVIVLGVAGVVGSLVGARALTHGGGSEPAAKAADAGPRPAGGLTVLGTVDTDPSPVKYLLPPVLPSGVIAKVYVNDGDEVKAGKELYAFDTTFQQTDVDRAAAQVAVARTLVAEAEELVKQHELDKKVADTTINIAQRAVEMRQKTFEFVEKQLEEDYGRNRIDRADWEDRKKASADRLKAIVEHTTALNDLDLAKLKRERLEKVNPGVKLDNAKAMVKQAESEKARAQAVVDLCVVKAKTDGTVEQLTIGPGTTLGVGTREPALWLIPAGKRVVRAEVEAEFAHRVGKDLEGKAVTVSDHTDAKLTYPGTVRRVGGTFLLKRGSPDAVLGGDTRVLEVVVEVTDPNPPGKPPLRVGQRVRVNLGR